MLHIASSQAGVTGWRQFGGTQTLRSESTILWDNYDAQTADVTLVMNGTLNIRVASAAPDGDVVILRVLQDSTGGRTLALHSSIQMGGRPAPVIASAANARSYLSFMKVGTNWVYLGIIKDE